LVACKAHTGSGIEGDQMKTATKTNTLQHLSAITGMLENDEVRKWKEQGGRVVGYLCSTIPEEMSI
jgi:hypothetical protein